jgi:hypothetical protein
VATSDAVTTGTTGPLADYAGAAVSSASGRCLDAMLRLDFDTAVPGAGPLLTKADVQAFRVKIGTVIDRASALVKSGVPANQLLMQLKTDDLGWAPRIPMVGCVRGRAERVRAELTLRPVADGAEERPHERVRIW